LPFSWFGYRTMPFWVLNGHSEQQPRETADDCRYLLRQIIKLSVVFYIALKQTAMVVEYEFKAKNFENICYNGRRENCVFVERISENFYTELESASQKGAFLGFNSRGLFLHPTMRSREPHCFQFIKEEQINPIEEFRGIDYGPSRRLRSRAKLKKKNHTQPNITLTPQLFELLNFDMGQNASHLEKETTDEFPANDHFYGLVNFGNTCYCNSVIQALYFCRPFREKVLNYKSQMKKAGNQKENLLLCLADLFHSISTQKRRVGTIAPKKFIGRLKKENDLFDNYMQQDAHEFLNYLLNTVADILLEEKRHEKRISGGHKVGSKGTTDTVSHTDGFGDNASSNQTQVKDKLAEHTWVHDVFQGTLTNETRCLNCETVSSKDEDFLDLSVDVQQNTSITHCLREFSATETLCNEQKYYCDICCSKQEAQKRMRIKKLPLILALHLKRFKYVEQYNRYTKLSYRVLFPLELRLFNTSHDAVNPDRMYDLVAVVVHCGSTPNRGHYITVVKSQGFWLLFDDDVVDKMDHINIEDFFGMAADGSLQKNSESGYILFYQARDI
ncbi:Ubiquitin carboxyl-terminal hydrolase 46, partial [Trichinella papuae]